MEQNAEQSQATQKSQQNKNTSQKKPEIHISATTKDRAEACKGYIERKYAKQIQSQLSENNNWQLLQKQMNALNFTHAEQELVKRDILQKQTEHARKTRNKRGPHNYEPLSIVGRGAFGEVRVCRDKETKQIVAIKKMKKQEMQTKNQISHVLDEQTILSTDNPWIVRLVESFQDFNYLYLVMEFLIGGDLMTVLMKKDILPEDMAKFYTAELVLAVASVHKMDYLHRDLKPDNVLLTQDGHIKLSDFGLCKKTEIKPKIDFGRKIQPDELLKNNPVSILTKRPANFQRNRQLAFSTVGTPDYIAPEVFGQKGYKETVDWWSIGVILFEMLVGYPPFFSEDPSMTCQKILHWKKTFQIPPEANLSPAAADLIKRLIADPTERLGINGVEEIKAHPFFCGIDWRNIRNLKAPYQPPVNDKLDLQNFDKFNDEDPWVEEEQKRGNRQNYVYYRGYTFQRDLESEQNPIEQAMINLEQTKMQFQQAQPQQQTTAIKTSVQRNYSPRPELQQNNGFQNPQLNNSQKIYGSTRNNGIGPKDMNQMYSYQPRAGQKSPGRDRPDSRGAQGVNQYQYNIKPNSQNRSPSPGTMQKFGNTYFLQQMNKNQYLYHQRDEKSPKGQGGYTYKYTNTKPHSPNGSHSNNGSNKHLPKMGSGHNSPRQGQDMQRFQQQQPYQPKMYNGGQRQYSPNSQRQHQ